MIVININGKYTLIGTFVDLTSAKVKTSVNPA